MPGHRKRRQFKQTDAFTRGMVIGLKRAVIVAVYACGVDVEKGPIRQQLWNAPPCDNVESWFGAQSHALNAYHECLKFTQNQDKNGVIPFLDVLVNTGSSIETTVIHHRSGDLTTRKGCLSPSQTILVGPGHPPQVRWLDYRKGISVSGSVLPRLKVASGSISTPRNHQRFVAYMDKVFQAEAFGLIKALENASELPIDTTVEVLLDNLSVVNSVLNCRTGNFLINRALLLISQLNRNGNRCSIRWIKGHSGIVGNDVADALAKSGAGSDLPSCYRLAPLSKLESTARKLAWAAWQSRFSSTTRPICTRFGLTPMSLLDKKYAFIVPSVHAVVGLLSGHTWTDSFSHKMGFIDDPTCPYCDSGAEETLEHILLECDSLDSLRTRLLFIAGKELGHTPRSLRDFIHSKSTWHACVDFLLASDRLKPRIREEDSEEASDSVSS
ncbi:hypothetical protein LAZ67_20000857 [Cordylochernes scorpioides]|uniref:RNase H type-1 domain-containing protein n=1 Tax=Cordylochernes scorpioides TaxID=51811 RepID=A0ABY6LNB5_9ARAC|nr:hypothetical protein LAZ67_20000857 [Cordylochernes scorpioides]